MLTPEEAAELRSLRRLAYAPGGALGAEDAARMRRLEALRVAASTPSSWRERRDDDSEADAAAGAPDEPVRPAQPAPVPSTDDPSRLPPEPGSASGAEDVSEDEPAAAPTRARRRWVPYAASALALVVGIGIGYAAFGRDAAPAIVLTDGQQKEVSRIDDANSFDPGSIVAVGEKRGVVVLRATKDGGDTQCLFAIGEDGESSANTCSTAEEREANGGAQFIGLDIPGEDEDTTDMLQAGIMTTVTGEEAVIVQIYPSYGGGAWDWRSQYTEDELVAADALVAAGHDGEALQLVGYDGDVPVWADFGATGMCVMVYDGERLDQACGEDGYQEPVVLRVTQGDGTVTGYSVAQTQRGMQLTILREGSVVSIDDKTGQIVEG